MLDYEFIIKPINFSELRKFASLSELVTFCDKNLNTSIQTAEIIIHAYIAQNLEKILSFMKGGDTLVCFISPEWTWDCLAGRAGYAIKRGEDYIYEKIVWMN